MTGEAHWFTLALFLAFAVGMGTYAVFSWLSTRRYQGRQRHIVCPLTGKEVDVLMVFDARTSRWTGVHMCSGWKSGTTCDLQCVDLENRRAVQAAAKSPVPQTT